MNLLQRLNAWRKETIEHPPLWIIWLLGTGSAGTAYMFGVIISFFIILPNKHPDIYNAGLQKIPPVGLLGAGFMMGLIGIMMFYCSIGYWELMKESWHLRKNGRCQHCKAILEKLITQ